MIPTSVLLLNLKGRYEGAAGGANSQEQVQFPFGACILSGAASHPYGASRIWQVNTAGQPFGPSPHGRCWSDIPWDVAMQFVVSGQLGLSKKLLMRYPWWRLEPHPKWADPHWGKGNYKGPYAGGIPGGCRGYVAATGSADVRGLATGAREEVSEGETNL